MTRGLQLLRDGASELGITLADSQLLDFSRFAAELAKWNRKINLTAISDEEGVVVKHFIDSLTVAARVRLEGKLLDIGSGGGFPGIPLSIISPELVVVSVDAVEKKIMFQRHAARILGLANFTALHARVESLHGRYAESFDIIISRAFTDLPSFVKMAMPMLVKSGTIVAMKGSEGKSECSMAEDELARLGFRVDSLYEFRLPVSGDRRTIITIKYDEPREMANG